MPIALSLDGKVALVTGGSRGIGAATVRMFVAAGARVLFNYEKAKAQSEALVKELGSDHCAAVACNLSGTGTAQELVAASVRRFGRLDILVVNHGVWPPRTRRLTRCPMRNGAAPLPSISTVFSRSSNIPSHK